MQLVESRVKKTLRNTFFGIIYKVVDVVLAFILRTIFIYTLGISYLGLSGLFTNILTVLSLAELGVGGAIVFSLYEPLTQDDYEKIRTLMRLYKRIYMVVGVVVSIGGILLVPFLRRIINLTQTPENIYSIYLLFVINTATSYFLSYKRSLLIADQRADIDTRNLILYRIIKFVIQSGVLVITKNYFLYLVIDIVNTVVSNIHISIKVDRLYPYLKTKRQFQSLEKKEKENIIKYVSSGLLFKIGQTVVTSTDNIIISAYINTALVGIFANYAMVTSSLEILIYMIFNGMTASIGNFAITQTKEDAKKLYDKVYFLNFCITFVCTSCLASLLSPFVALWAGKKMVLENLSVYIIVLNFYLSTLQKGTEVFIGAVGEMYYKNRYKSLIEGSINLVVSLYLVKFTNLGVAGVFLGTTVCLCFGRVWMDAYTLYKNWFCLSFTEYLVKYLKRFGLTIISCVLNVVICNYVFGIVGVSIVSWIICGIIVISIAVLILVILFHDRTEYRYFLSMIKKNRFF